MKVISVSNNYNRVKMIPLDGSNFRDEIFQKHFTATASVDENGSIRVRGKLVDDMTSISISRRLDDSGRMILTTTIDDVKCVRVFARK